MRPRFKQMVIEAIELMSGGGAKSKGEATRIIGKKYDYNSENLRKAWNKYTDLAKIKEDHRGLANH